MSSSTAREKAVLLITGSWHVPKHYQKLISQLEAKGVRVICERLPTNNNATPPNKTLHDDIQFIKDIVAKQVAARTHLVVVAHSYGGMLAAASLAEFAVAPDAAEGGVTDIILMAAFIPTEGQCLASFFSDKLPPSLTELPHGTVNCVDPRYYFYNDVTEEEAQLAMDLLANQQPLSALLDPIPGDMVAWRTIPTSYVVCERDTIIPPALQDTMIGRARAEGGVIKEYRIPASHSPFLSMPEKMVEIILEVRDSH